MNRHIEVFERLYRTLVGEDGARDLPHPPPENGYYFCCMSTVNRLWASIRFEVSQNCGRTVAIKIYAPGKGYQGRDAVYLTIGGRGDSSTSSRCFVDYDLVDDERIRHRAKIAECKVILALCQKMVNESGILEYPFQTKA